MSAGAVRRLSVASRGGRGGSPCARALSGGCLRHRWERALCRRKRCDLLRRPYCENEKSPIVGALRVRWDSRGFRFGHATGFTRLHRILAVAGFSPTLLESLVVTSFTRSRWAPGCAGLPILLAEALVRLRADGRRRTRKYAGTSVRVRFWGARRSVRGYLVPRFRLHRRTEHGRQRRVRTAFRG